MSIGRLFTSSKKIPPGSPAVLVGCCLLAVGCWLWAVGCWLPVVAVVAAVAAVADAAAAFGGASGHAAGNGVSSSGTGAIKRWCCQCISATGAGGVLALGLIWCWWRSSRTSQAQQKASRIAGG